MSSARLGDGLARGIKMVFFSSTEGLDAARLTAQWWDRFDESERARVATFRLDRDRRDYVAAHALLRLAAAMVRGGDAIVSPSVRAGWSLAHCTGLVVCAVDRDPSWRPGVDAEPLSTADRLASMTSAFVTPAEDAWLGHGGPGRARQLVELWTVKEAVLKSRGQGITGPSGLAVLMEIECWPAERVDDWTRYDVHAPGEQRAAWATVWGDHVVAFSSHEGRGAPALVRVAVQAHGRDAR